MPFFVLLALYGLAMTYFMAGAQPFQGTTLVTPVTPVSATFVVASTSGFQSSGRLQVGQEIVDYTGDTATTFTGLSRGQYGTASTAHAAGTAVLAHELGLLDNLLGYNIVENLSSGSALGVGAGLLMIPLGIGHSLYVILLWDYSFLDGTAGWIKLPLWAVSVGLVYEIAFAVFRLVRG